jgi:membrane protease YdiL (CAAX protease family)
VASRKIRLAITAAMVVAVAAGGVAIATSGSRVTARTAAPVSWTSVPAGTITMMVPDRWPALRERVAGLARGVESAWRVGGGRWPALAAPRETVVYLWPEDPALLRWVTGGGWAGGRRPPEAGEAPVAFIPRLLLRAASGAGGGAGGLAALKPRERAAFSARVTAAAASASLPPRRWTSGPRGGDVVAEGFGWLVGLQAEGIDPFALTAAVRGTGAAQSLATVLEHWRSLPLGAEQLASFIGHSLDRYGPDKLASLYAAQPSGWRNWAEFGGWWNGGALAQVLTGRWAGGVVEGEWLRSLPAPAPAWASEAARDTLQEWRLAGLAGMVAGVVMVGAALLALAGREWRRRGLLMVVLTYLGLSVFEFWFGTSRLDPFVKLALAYAEMAAVIWAAVWLGRSGRTVTAGPTAPDGGSPSHPLPVLPVVMGYFLLIMVLRLSIYGQVREIWAKSPMIMLTLFALLLVEGGQWADIGLTLRRWRSQVALTVAGTLVSRLVYSLASLITAGVALGGVTRGAFGLIQARSWPMVFSFLYGNFAEEIFFRGYVQSRLERRMSWLSATFVQSLLFGLFHINYNGFPPDPLGLLAYVFFAFVFGVEMTLLYRATGSMLVPVVVHPLWNMRFLRLDFVSRHGWTWANNDVVWTIGNLVTLGLAIALIPPMMKGAAALIGPGGLNVEGWTIAGLRSFAQQARAWFIASPRRTRERWIAGRREFARRPLLYRIMAAYWIIVVPGVFYLIFVSSMSGRKVFASVLIAGVVSVAVAVVMRRAHRSTLRELASSLGLDYIETPVQERGHPLVDRLKWQFMADVYRWKVGGAYPYAVGNCDGFPVVIRRPPAVDFDTNAPDSTRLGVYLRSAMDGFMIYSARRRPKGRRFIATGDPAFDQRYVVCGQRPDEVAAVLTASVRRDLLALDRAGLTGIEVGRFGVLYYEPGLVAEKGVVEAILAVLLEIARRAKESGDEAVAATGQAMSEPGVLR